MTVIIMSGANFASELASALKENSFGLKDYQVIRESQLESIATVMLLEGEPVTVSLSPRGFEVGFLIGYLFFASPLTIDKIRLWIKTPRSSTKHSSSYWTPSVRLIGSRANRLCSHALRSSQPHTWTRGHVLLAPPTATSRGGEARDRTLFCLCTSSII